MSNMLKLTKKIAKSRLSVLANDLFYSNKISCILDDTMSVFVAGSHIADDGQIDDVYIGVSEIFQAKFDFRNRYNVSDSLFVQSVINMYHEQMHCLQRNNLFKQPTVDKRQLVQEIACRGNYDYYFRDGNYTINANEIQAEQYGIMQAYDYFCSEYDDIDSKYHEKLLVDIVNNKMNSLSYFIKNHDDFTSLQEIIDAFDDAYDASFSQKRMYYVNNKDTKDCVKQYMQSHDDARNVYLSLTDSLEKDKCVASINLELHPAWVRQYPALQNIDLSYDKIIRKPYEKLMHSPESRLSILAYTRGDDEMRRFGGIMTNKQQRSDCDFDL